MCDIARKALARVYVSLSECIYTNLAFEEHIFRSHDVASDGDVMLMWSNRPTVVIGRHQNPWTELNLPFICDQNIDFARRHSGGGAVYHDGGNLNISLITSHKDHCRPRNLNFISQSINDRYRLNIVPNKRDDMELMPGNRKCSGTAARIVRDKAYHHLTLLIDVDVERLKTSLRSPLKGHITTNATQSVRAPAVGYLREDNQTVNKDTVRDTVAEAFANRYERCDVVAVDVDDVLEDSVATNYKELRSDEWRWGKTPKFSVTVGGESWSVEKGIVTGSSEELSIGRKFSDLSWELYGRVDGQSIKKNQSI